jgi:hypothetical protein
MPRKRESDDPRLLKVARSALRALRAGRKFVADERYSLVANATFPGADGKPDEATLDECMRPYVDACDATLRKIDRAIKDLAEEIARWDYV